MLRALQKRKFKTVVSYEIGPMDIVDDLGHGTIGGDGHQLADMHDHVFYKDNTFSRKNHSYSNFHRWKPKLDWIGKESMK